MHLLGCQKARNQIFWYKPHRFCCYDGITLILPSYKKQLFSFSWINTLKDSLNNIKHYLFFDIWKHIPKLSKRKHSQANIFFSFYTREHFHFWSEVERFFLTCYVSQVSFINVVLNRENFFLPVEYFTVFTKFDLRKSFQWMDSFPGIF